MPAMDMGMMLGKPCISNTKRIGQTHHLGRLGIDLAGRAIDGAFKMIRQADRKHALVLRAIGPPRHLIFQGRL